MKNHEMFAFVRGFNQFDGLEGFDFILLLNKNKRLFEGEIKMMQSARESNSKFNEYKEKAQALLAEHADKDESGQPIIDPAPGQPGQGNYRVVENREAFNAAHETLVTEYKEAIEKQNTLDAEFNNKLDADIFVQPYYIKEDLLPRNLKSGQMNLLYPLVKFELEKAPEEEPALEKVE